MESAEYEGMFLAEDRHFWFRGKRAWIDAMLDRAPASGAAGPSLDAGCGTGANLQLLARRGPAFGVERNPQALAFCRRRGLHERVVGGSVNRLPFRDEAFALVGLFDVLYHRDVEPAQALAEARRVLRPGGHLLVTDSAMPWLAGPHDAAVWGARRFTSAGMRALVRAAGLEVLRASYANCLLFPLVVALRVAERMARAPRSVARVPPAPVNAALLAVQRAEAALLRAGLDMPWGSSILCLARRP